MSVISSWDEVIRAFQRKNDGMNPMQLTPQSWLNVAAEYEALGRNKEAKSALNAGIFREYRDMDVYNPHPDMILMWCYDL